MSSKQAKRIGLIVGRERNWPAAFMKAINEADHNITAEFIKLSGTTMGEPCAYDLIIDRMSHEIPYYRSYLEYVALQGVDIINNPFMSAMDNRFMGHVVINKLGLSSPRTIALPNKDVEQDVVPDSFRNLSYPMDWQGIINYVGVPAILKDVRVGGRRIVYRVNSVDELLQRYDESGTRTMILQEIIEADTHIHCFVINQKDVMTIRYSLENGRYLANSENNKRFNAYFADTALMLTKAYGYDINMVEFVLRDGQPYVINSTNPIPVIDKPLMLSDQFEWCVKATVQLAIQRATEPNPVQHLFRLDTD